MQVAAAEDALYIGLTDLTVIRRDVGHAAAQPDVVRLISTQCVCVCVCVCDCVCDSVCV